MGLFYLTHCDIIIRKSTRNWYFTACNITTLFVRKKYIETKGPARDAGGSYITPISMPFQTQTRDDGASIDPLGENQTTISVDETILSVGHLDDECGESFRTLTQFCGWLMTIESCMLGRLTNMACHVYIHVENDVSSLDYRICIVWYHIGSIKPLCFRWSNT